MKNLGSILSMILFASGIFNGPVAAADVSLPAINSDLQDISCELRIVTRDLLTGEIEDSRHGSGTFIKTNLFATAAHCVTGFYYPYHAREFVKTYVACPGGRNVAVKSWIVHPQYFAPGVFDSSHMVNYPKVLAGPESFSNADMAMMVTEPTRVENIKVAATDQMVEQQIADKSCRLLGYSPQVCNEATGENCFRSVELADRKLKFGFLSVENSHDFGSGDSGSGIVCGKGIERYWVGLYRSMTRNEEGLSASHNNSFLAPLLKMSEKELLMKAEEIQFSPDFISASVALSKTKLLVGAATNNRTQLSLNISVSESAPITNILQTFMTKNPTALVRWADQGIGYINLSETKNHEPLLIEKNFLYISPRATLADLERATR